MHLDANINTQTLALYSSKNTLIQTYNMSSAANGVGQINGSECTPLGKHTIRAKIGQGCIANTIFVGRRPTGEVYTPDIRKRYPNRDWILTRILWLCGTQIGYNRLGNVDSMRRYIYIHGTPNGTDMTVAGSRGCLRIRNDDIIELFNQVTLGTVVNIHE